MDFGFHTVSSSDHEVLFESGSRKQPTGLRLRHILAIPDIEVLHLFKIGIGLPHSIAYAHDLLLYIYDVYIVIECSTIVKHL